ncbi:hypothetical protein LXL04_017749 [Taraxacum kok-saghyz]
MSATVEPVHKQQIQENRREAYQEDNDDDCGGGTVQFRVSKTVINQVQELQVLLHDMPSVWLCNCYGACFGSSRLSFYAGCVMFSIALFFFCFILRNLSRLSMPNCTIHFIYSHFILFSNGHLNALILGSWFLYQLSPESHIGFCFIYVSETHLIVGYILSIDPFQFSLFYRDRGDVGPIVLILLSTAHTPAPIDICFLKSNALRRQGLIRVMLINDEVDPEE